MKKLVKPLLIALCLSIVNVSVYLFGSHYFETFDVKLRDLMMEIRGTIPHSGNVVIVDIDEKSLKELGQWTWSRDKLSKIVDNLTTLKAGAIGFDIVFAERDEQSPSLMAHKLGIVGNFPHYDEIFSQSVAQSPTILGYTFQMEKDSLPPLAGANIPAIFIEKNKVSSLLNPYRPILNIPVLQNNAYSSGFFNMTPDKDGIVRFVPLVMEYNKNIYPSLSLEMVRAALGAKKVTLQYDDNGLSEINLGQVSIPTDGLGRLAVNYYGAAKTFTYISASDVYFNRCKMSDFEGKFVLIGTSAAGLLDLRATPLESVYPGVEVHATIIENILTQNFLQKPSWSLGLELVIITLLPFIFAVSSSYLNALKGFFVFVVTLGSLVTSMYSLFLYEGLLLTMAIPLLVVGISYLLFTVRGYIIENRQKEFIKAKFAKKVSPQVAEDILKQHDTRLLEGKDKEITIFFSDVRGFTTLSEAMGSPKALIDLLNEYMTPMVDIIISHHGTIDKFIGDAIMAYWNAPNDVDNHADHAVQSALEQMKALEVLNIRLKTEGKPEIAIGIGINTGVCTVGEMGSEGRSDYTIIGDPVNLASRLEGLTKNYGASILVSEFTVHQLKEEYMIRELDVVRVKGKHEPVAIFEVCHQGLATPQEEEALTLYTKALTLYRQSHFHDARDMFESLYQTYGDKLYHIYCERCDHFCTNPPENFDGVFTFTTK